MSHLMMRYGKTGSGAYFFWVEAQSQIYGVFGWKSTHSNMGVVIPKIVVWRLLFFEAKYMVFLGGRALFFFFFFGNAICPI